MSFIIAPLSGNHLFELPLFFRICLTHTIAKEGFGEWYDGEIESESNKKYEIAKQSLSTHQNEITCLVATIGTSIAGTIAFTSLPTNFHIRKCCPEIIPAETPEICLSYVLPEHQSQGVGTALFDAIIDKLQRAGYAGYCLDCGFTHAQSYWQKRCGKPYATIEDYFGKDIDQMIWRNTF
jgi:GNAT superfamily N-acetyltransferase